MTFQVFGTGHLTGDRLPWSDPNHNIMADLAYTHETRGQIFIRWDSPEHPAFQYGAP